MVEEIKPSIKLLVFEDDVGIAKLINRRLLNLGYKVCIASDGKEGLKELEKNEYDLLILDYHLPKLSGMQVLEKLMQRYPPPSIIMVTAVGDEKTAVTALQMGALDYIVKDLDGGYLELLPIIISRTLEKKRLIDEKREAEEALKRAYAEVEQKVKDRTAELEKANLELQALDILRRNLLANISHELLTPLTVIKGSNEILLSRVLGELDPRVLDLIAASQDKVEYLISLVDNILILQKGEFRPETYFTEKANVIDIIESALAKNTFELNRKNIHIRRQYERDYVPAICNPKDLNKVLENLISNAVKFSSSNSEIILKAQADFDYTMITVTDEGIGIDPSEQERIFQRFYQVDTSTTRKFGGAGLGLAICRELVGLQNGEIGVQSEIDKGATFWVKLPCGR